MREASPYHGTQTLRLGAAKRRLFAFFLACALCFVQQVAVLHYARTHGISERGFAYSRVSAGSALATTGRKSASSARINRPDACAFCVFESTLTRPAVLVPQLLTHPDTVAISPIRPSVLRVKISPNTSIDLSSPRAPPFLLS
jgi:hypothetical protein